MEKYTEKANELIGQTLRNDGYILTNIGRDNLWSKS